jgi:hypothetical protein
MQDLQNISTIRGKARQTCKKPYKGRAWAYNNFFGSPRPRYDQKFAFGMSFQVKFPAKPLQNLSLARAIAGLTGPPKLSISPCTKAKIFHFKLLFLRMPRPGCNPKKTGSGLLR